MPFPNLIAGILIGVVNDSWIAVLIGCAIWPFIFCAQVAILEKERAVQSIEDIKINAQKIFMNSATLTFYAMEFFTGFITALVVGVITHLLKNIFS